MGVSMHRQTNIMRPRLASVLSLYQRGKSVDSAWTQRGQRVETIPLQNHLSTAFVDKCVDRACMSVYELLRSATIALFACTTCGESYTSYARQSTDCNEVKHTFSTYPQCLWLLLFLILLCEFVY